MIPKKINNTFIEFQVDLSGRITQINAGVFCKQDFIINHSVYDVCPFLEGVLEALNVNKLFSMDGMLIQSKNEEFNIEVSLLKVTKSITVLIENRTNIYKYITQLNQHRNDISLVKEQIAKQNIELDRLRKIADKANEEKSRFLAFMSHEVRNPLNSILAYADIILEEVNNAEIKKYATSLKTSGKNLNVIVNDILDISRIEAGKLELVKESFSIKELIKSSIESFRVQYKESLVDLHYNLPENLPKNVIGDKVRINQILSNLIKNAYKFTKKGSISVNITIIYQKENSIKVNFKVKDSGRGMTQKQLQKIFNEYEQTQVADFTISRGAGLGLSIVKSLVERMSGTVAVKSELEKGSVFSFEIPFEIQSERKATKKSAEEKQPKDLEGLKVLFADDDVLNQSIGKHFLEKEKINVSLVSDGFEAFLKLQKEAFDLMLIDIHMPNISGQDLVKKINEFLNENQQIPIIAVTANLSKHDIQNYKDIGFTDVIGKPYSAKDLLVVIQKNL